MSEQEARLLDRVTKRAAIMRTWGVDESKVDYDLPLGDAWLLVHLGDMLTTATEQVAVLAQVRDIAQVGLDQLRQRLADVEAERDKWRDQMMNATVALGREGGAFYDDVPKHIRALKAERERLRAALKEALQDDD
jgi:hypothetical protein